MKSFCPYDDENNAERGELEKILQEYLTKTPPNDQVFVLRANYDKLLHALMRWKNVGQLLFD